MPRKFISQSRSTIFNISQSLKMGRACGDHVKKINTIFVVEKCFFFARKCFQANDSELRGYFTRATRWLSQFKTSCWRWTISFKKLVELISRVSSTIILAFGQKLFIFCWCLLSFVFMVGGGAYHGINSLKNATSAPVPPARAAADSSGSTGAPLHALASVPRPQCRPPPTLWILLYLPLSSCTATHDLERSAVCLSATHASLPSIENVSSQEKFSAEIALLVVSPWLREGRPWCGTSTRHCCT